MDIGATTGSSSSFNQDFFTNLLVTELQYQDPDNPVSDSDMVSEISSMAMVQGMSTLNTSFSQVLQLQTLLSSTDLIGRQVQYTNSDGQSVQGQVQSVDTTGNSINLMIDGTDVPATSVTQIL